MLTIRVPLSEKFDEETNRFIVHESYDIRMEHSLVSLSKWEQKYKKPFLSDQEKTPEEALWYIRAMCLDEVPDDIFDKLSRKNYLEINNYIEDNQTATWFRDSGSKSRNREVITNEVIYYWMLTLNIEMICETWHLSRLMTLIRVTSEKNQPAKKMSAAEIAQRNRELNAKRKAELNTQG